MRRDEGGRCEPLVSSAPLLTRSLRIAGTAADAGVREVPRRSNPGPEVDAYLRHAGIPSRHA